MPKNSVRNEPDVTPYLSIVVAARNDDHGGNLLSRMQIFTSGLLEQVRCHDLQCELIVVEWNPPEDRAKLLEALRWPEAEDLCDVRFIEVPAHVHRQFAHSESLPLFQMIAKNVGMRRARGQFILATNVDIVFSDELISFLAKRSLEKDCMYRIDRFDVRQDVPVNAPQSERLAYCRDNVIRIAQRDGMLNPSAGERIPRRSRRYWPGRLYDCLQDLRVVPILRPSRLHTNACGDFTLIARDHWFCLRGYPEFQMYSMHIDAVLCHMAYHSGLREVVLRDPMRIYHIEHGAGSGWTPEGESKLNNRLAAAGIPQLHESQVAGWATQMRRERRPRSFNNEHWGLALEALPEESVLPAATSSDRTEHAYPNAS